MTQEKNAWFLPIPFYMPVDEDRVEWITNDIKTKFKKIFTVNKQKRILNKVKDSAQEFMSTDPNVKKQVDRVMQVYVDNYYNRIWPAHLQLRELYQQGEYYEFLIALSGLYNSSVIPLVQSAQKGLNTVSKWMEQVYKDAYNHFAKEYGLEAQQEQQAQQATASVGYCIASLDPKADFSHRTAFILPFPMIMFFDKDDPEEVKHYKPFMPPPLALFGLLKDSLKKRSKNKKERKYEKIREQDVMYLANKWARREVNQNSQVQKLAKEMLDNFLVPLTTGKRNLKMARYNVKKGDLYDAVQDVAYAYQQNFSPVMDKMPELAKAMEQASAIFQAHIQHFGNYVAKGGKLPTIASVQPDYLRIGEHVYRPIATE